MAKSSFGGGSSSSGKKMYSTSFKSTGGNSTATSKVAGTLSGYDKEGNAILDTTGKDVGTTVKKDGMKVYNPKSEEYTRLMDKYKTNTALEGELNKRGYTMKQFTGGQQANVPVSQQPKPLVNKALETARVKYGSDEGILAKAATVYGKDSSQYKTIENRISGYDPNKYATQSGAIQSDLYENKTVPNTDKAVDKTNLGMETSIDEQARKKIEVQEETARREREAVKEVNSKKDDRILAREAQMQGVFNKYQGETEESKKAIDENVKNLAQAQAGAARIAAGQAGQGATMSEGARQAVESDISMRYAQNVAEAEGAAITQKQGLTEAQKNAGVANVSEQDKIDVLMNGLTDAEYQVFIKSIQDIGLTKTLAKDTYANFILEQNKTVSGEMLNRKLRELKTAANQDMFKTGTKADKIELIDSQLKDVPGYNNFKAKAIDLIGKGLELDDIIATISGLAQAQFDAYSLTQNISIQDKDILSKSAKDLSDAELERLLEIRKQK